MVIYSRTLDFNVDGQWRTKMPMKTWMKQVEGKGVKVGLRRKDTLCHSKWSVGVNRFAAGLR